MGETLHDVTAALKGVEGSDGGVIKSFIRPLLSRRTYVPERRGPPSRMLMAMQASIYTFKTPSSTWRHDCITRNFFFLPPTHPEGRAAGIFKNNIRPQEGSQAQQTIQVSDDDLVG